MLWDWHVRNMTHRSKSSPLTIFVNKILLEHSLALSLSLFFFFFANCLLMLLRQNGRVGMKQMWPLQPKTLTRHLAFYEISVPSRLRHYILSGPWSSTSPKLSEDSADKEERQEVTMSVTWLLPLTSYCPVA